MQPQKATVTLFKTLLHNHTHNNYTNFFNKSHFVYKPNTHIQAKRNKNTQLHQENERNTKSYIANTMTPATQFT